MKKFLEYVAEDIVNKYGTNLSNIAVVFPNKRASIFLNEQLAIERRVLYGHRHILLSATFSSAFIAVNWRSNKTYMRDT